MPEDEENHAGAGNCPAERDDRFEPDLRFLLASGPAAWYDRGVRESPAEGRIRMKENLVRFRRVLRWLTAAAYLATGLCLIAACLRISRLGPRPFTPETVRAAFRPIRFLPAVCLALSAAGLLLDALLPQAAPKRKGEVRRSPDRTGERKAVRLARGILFGLALLLLVLGVAGDGVAGVIAKAVNICSECVGLG